MTVLTLSTPRLHLDAVLPSDADAVLAYCVDEELQGYVPVPIPYTRESAVGYVEGYAPKNKNLWAIRMHEGGPLLGVIELKPNPLASAELGYWLGRPHRGAGIMSEAAVAVVDHGFASGLDHITWCAVVGNTGSAVVARRAGFHYEGLRRRALEHRDHRLDGWFASLLSTDDRTPQDGWPL